MKKSFSLLIALFFVVSCGGGGGGGDSSSPPPPAATITPPAQNLIGTYTLSSFELYYDNGSIIKSTDATVRSYSGTWKLRSDLTTTQTVELNGTTFNMEGTRKINASTGKLECITTTGIASVLDITTSGNVLTTNVHVVTNGGYREFDHWTKVSDSVAMATSALKIASDAEPASVTETVDMPEDENGPPDYQIGTLAGQLLEEGK